MAWQYLFRAWLANAAKEKLYEAAEEAVRAKLRPDEETAEGSGHAALPGPCDAGIVFATKPELGGLYDLLRDVRTLAGQRFTIHLGTLRGRQVAAVQCGEGYAATARATQALIDGHHPCYVVAAGFAHALQDTVRPGHVILATHVADETHELAIEWPFSRDAVAALQDDLYFGRLLTLDHALRTAAEREELGRRYNALVLDHESLAAAEVCHRQRVPFLAVRIVRHALHEKTPADIRHLTKQHSLAGRLGAALGAVARRPGSVNDMWQMKEDSLVASDRLAKCLQRIFIQIGSSSQDC